MCQSVWVKGTPLSSIFFSPDTAFLLSDGHVTAMLQCLEAVEQNNPRLLAQIDTSMVSWDPRFYIWLSPDANWLWLLPQGHIQGMQSSWTRSGTWN